MSNVPTRGQMRQTISLEQVDKPADGTGGREEDYYPWFTTKGKLKIKRSYGKFETGYDESVKEYDLWIPWRHELEVNMSKDVRIFFEARSFKVEAFDMVNDERSIFHIELTELR
jgi:head-tail adaptor